MDGQIWVAVAIANGALALGAAALWWRERRRRGRLRGTLARARSEIDTLVTQDRLTGLLSRSDFDLALDEAVSRRDQGGSACAVLYVDLDNLRAINEGYGHASGDAVLREVATRLPLPGQVVARIANDEFAILVGGGREEAIRAAKAVAERVARPIQLAGTALQDLQLSCSIGIAAYPDHGSRLNLLNKAALAMRSVKALGGGGHAEYTAALGEAQREQAELLHDLRHALERGQFELAYQPKVEARSLQVTAAEALIRWKHPQRGIVSPTVFVPIAERHGLMGAIGDWVIREACRQAAAWRRQGLRMRVAVNISGVQLRQDSLVGRIEAALREHGIPAGRFTCEITESVAMEDTQATTQAFERLRGAGVHVSIDDFGTGHSSLATLRRLPAAELKIDRAFVCDLETSANARAIVHAIVEMAHTLDLRVVAEGVETEGQRDLLVQMGCDELQGYLFARPMSSTAIALWATDDRPTARDSSSSGAFRPSLFEETRPAPMLER